jgi:nitrite reductase (NADH) small subunit
MNGAASSSPNSPWIRVCKIDDCPPGEAREFVVGQRVVAVFHAEDRFFALDGICPHQGGPLGRGRLGGCRVTCPWHGWQFDIRDGQHSSIPSLVQPGWPVRVEGEDVFIQIDE